MLFIEQTICWELGFKKKQGKDKKKKKTMMVLFSFLKSPLSIGF